MKNAAKRIGSVGGKTAAPRLGLRFARLLGPSTIRVGHPHIREREFRFTLTLTRPLFGHLVDQAILIRDGD